MMNQPDQDPNQPYPDVRGAFTLTLLAMLAAAFTGVAFIDSGAALEHNPSGRPMGPSSLSVFQMERRISPTS